MQWLLLQQDMREDFVIATGVQYSVRQFIEKIAVALGMQILWQEECVAEVGYWTNPQLVFAGAKDVIAGYVPQSMPSEITVIRIDPRYLRPTEVETLLGDPTKAKERLGWVPEITLDEMVLEMVATDLADAKKNALLKQHGFQTIFVKEH